MSKSLTTGVRIGAALLLALGWVLGCAVEEEAGELGVAGFTDATPSDLTHRAFQFGPDAGLFPEEDPRFGRSATLFIGELRSSAASAGFALSADDGSLQGGVLQFRPCDFITTFLQQAGEEPLIDSFVSQDFFEWCGVDSEGRLGVQDDDETLPVISEPATEPSVELDAMVALSAGLVVDPPFPLDQRVETGTVELQVFGNVLSYTVTIENLTPTDEVRNGQIRRGGASENGDVLVTLFGEPIPPVRSWGPPFLEGSTLTASAFITPDEVAALTDPETPLYVLFTSQQISSGLMRGQLRDAP